MGAILTNRSASELHGGASRVEAFTVGLNEALYVAAGIAFSALLWPPSSSAATRFAAVSSRAVVEAA